MKHCASGLRGSFCQTKVCRKTWFFNNLAKHASFIVSNRYMPSETGQVGLVPDASLTVAEGFDGFKVTRRRHRSWGSFVVCFTFGLNFAIEMNFLSI